MLNHYLFRIIEKIFAINFRRHSENSYLHFDHAYRMVSLYVFQLVCAVSFFVFAGISYFVLQKPLLALFQLIASLSYSILLLLLRKGVKFSYIAFLNALLTAVWSITYTLLSHSSYDSLLWTIFVIYSIVFFLPKNFRTIFLLVYYFVFLGVGIYGVYFWEVVPWDFVILLYFSMAFFVLYAFISFHEYTIFQMQEKLIFLSETDFLTNMNNRRKIERILEYEFIQARSKKIPLSVCIFDIDNFKKINDNFGHLAGDRALVEFSSFLKENIPPQTFLGRWGGEEFMWVLPAYNFSSASKLVKEIKEKISEHHFSKIEKLTCSFGISSEEIPRSLESFFREADQAMYQAKEQGKDRIVAIKIS